MTDSQFKEFISYISKMIIFELVYVNFMTHNQKVIIEEITTEKKIDISNQKKKKSNSNRSKKIKSVKNINVTDEIIKRVKANKKINTEKNEKREYNRQLKSWNVRGYWRTYKSGKKVWISPQTRKARTGKSKIKGCKNYIIKNTKEK